MPARARRVLSAFAVLFATLPCGIAHATWPSDPSVNVPLCTAPNVQREPAIASDGAGGAIVTWMDKRDSAGTRYDVYVQRVSAAGVPLWTHDGVALCAATTDQVSPAISTDGAGGAIITWMDHRNGSLPDIYAQRVNADGVPQWTPNGVALCTESSSQNVPRIITDGAGGAIVAWMDSRSSTGLGYLWDIYAQRVNAAGEPQWATDGAAICTAVDEQSSITMVSDGLGGAFVAWLDYRSSSSDLSDIYAQRINGAGVPQWTADGVGLCVEPAYQQTPAIVADGAGGAIVTWQDGRGFTSYDIYAQRVDAAGAPQWTANGVALCTAPANQYLPALVSDNAGGAIVAWYDYRVGPSSDIYAQRVNAAGVPQWAADGVAVCDAAGDQYFAATVSDGAGGAIVTWNDLRNGNTDVFGQRMNGAGIPQWSANGVAVSTADRTQLLPRMVSDGAGGAIVAWQDSRSDSVYDIYAQNLSADGTIGGTTLSAPPTPIAARFALSRIQPNPSPGDLRVSFSLRDATPATLDLYDLTGRRIESQSVGTLGPGPHTASLISHAPLPPGVYSLSLEQGSQRAVAKVAIVR